MIQAAVLHNQPQQHYTTRKVLTMVKNERMGGFVPKWETVKTPIAQSPQAHVESTVTQTVNQAGNTDQAASQLLSYNAYDNTTPETIDTTANIKTTNTKQNDDSFGFGDLIDMVNPLHHIPFAGHLYRELTGDSIKPIGKIIGGAAFYGPIGAASGLIDAIIIHETGQDLAKNAMNIAFNNEISTVPQKKDKHLTNTQQDHDITQTLLSFSDLTQSPNSEKSREAITHIALSKQRTTYNS